MRSQQQHKKQALLLPHCFAKHRRHGDRHVTPKSSRVRFQNASTSRWNSSLDGIVCRKRMSWHSSHGSPFLPAYRKRVRHQLPCPLVLANGRLTFEGSDRAVEVQDEMQALAPLFGGLFELLVPTVRPVNLRNSLPPVLQRRVHWFRHFRRLQTRRLRKAAPDLLQERSPARPVTDKGRQSRLCKR